MNRCFWSKNDPLMIAYHDKEWGVPVHDDNIHFEFIVLDAFQAGLSWSIVLNKPELSSKRRGITLTISVIIISLYLY